ncbi:hypothetical protein [Polaribacter marinivivus]|uniref:Uncharacterized protein n=1 Tax=Polaribacter marinivivus TaxID=1524260 RepID=A0ABV8R866_9FLAO
MKLLYQKVKKRLQFYGLLLFSIATSFCCYAQEENLDDIDGLIDELFFNDQQFLDELIEGGLTYNFLYTSVSYNTNTFFSGRDSGTDQFNIIPQVSYYHSSGFNASISGIYYQNFAPAWDFTSVSVGYFNTIGKQKNFNYNLGYTHFFYSDDFDDFTNSIDLSVGFRNTKRTLGTTLAASYLFGTDTSLQLVSNSFLNINLKRTSNLALRFRPNISFIIADQTYTFSSIIRSPLGPRIVTVVQEVFDLLNTQLSFPLSLSTKSWDFEIGYHLNLPNAVSNESNLSNTNFFSFSVGYLLDLNKN